MNAMGPEELGDRMPVATPAKDDRGEDGNDVEATAATPPLPENLELRGEDRWRPVVGGEGWSADPLLLEAKAATEYSI